ncbi:MAG: thioredoxin-dependent thiol peroxidase [Candidatus Aenigmatarchaeota archaeon]
MKEGEKAPDFSAKNDSGRIERLSDLRGRMIILYFYPKDDTSGCIMEACSFRDNIRSLGSKGALVLGVSPDSSESHKKFKKKHGLNFSLLSDLDNDVCKKYCVLKNKSFMGKNFTSVERTTFIIDMDGKIIKIFKNVNPMDHAKDVIKFLDSAKM